MTVVAPNNMIVNGYTYDALKRLSSLSCLGLKTITATNIYNPNGKLASVSAKEAGADRTSRTFTYDSEQRLQTINGIYNGVQKLSLSYAYNNAQQIVTRGESIESINQCYTYVYDQRDQLSNETVSSETTVYSYDQAQNRKSKKVGAATADGYGYTIANKLTNIWRGSQSASSRYWYDLAGNLVTSIVKNVTNCYYYNVQNKLVKIVGTNFVHEFKYNSRSERIAVGIGPSTNSLVWRYDASQGPVTLAEFDSTNNMTRWYVRGLGVVQGIGDVIAEVDVSGQTPKAHYYLCNHRGDTLVVLNPDGAANSTFRYDAFGNCYAATGPFMPRNTFSTKEYLPDAKLYLYAYRVYDPIAGRWTQRDPIDYQDSINLYQFCGNNPVSRQDPAGLAVIKNQTPDPIEVEGGPGVLQGHDGPSEKAILPPGQSIGRDSPKTGDAGGAITDADRINGTRVSGDDLFPVITVKGYVEITPGYYMSMPGGKTVYELNVIATVLGVIQSGAERLGNWLGDLSTRFF